MVRYQKICTRGRTVYYLQPVLITPEPWVADAQALPPWGWCDRCGREVFRRGSAECRRCEKRHNV